VEGTRNTYPHSAGLACTATLSAAPSLINLYKEKEKQDNVAAQPCQCKFGGLEKKKASAENREGRSDARSSVRGFRLVGREGRKRMRSRSLGPPLRRLQGKKGDFRMREKFSTANFRRRRYRRRKASTIRRGKK